MDPPESGQAGRLPHGPWLLGAACALLVVRPVFPCESAAAEGEGLPIVMLWLALAVFWLLGVIGRREFRLRFGWTDAAVLVLIFLLGDSAVWGALHGSPRPSVNMLWEWIGLGMSFFLLRQFAVGRRENRAVLAAMVALAVALSAYGYYQYSYALPKTRAAYKADPQRLLREAGLSFDADPRQVKVFEDRLNSPEPIARFELTNSLAGFLAPWLAVTIGVAVLGAGTIVAFRSTKVASETVPSRPSELRENAPFAERKATMTERKATIAVAACAVAIAGCLVLTTSRSAYLATLFGLALLGLWVGRRFWRHWKLLVGVGAVLAVVIAIAVATRGVNASIFTQAGKSLGYRLQYWQATARMIGDHPLLGVGPGNFQAEYTRYKLPEAAEEIADPHNFLLEVWATGGSGAVLALLAALGLFYRAVFKKLRTEAASSPSPPTPLPQGGEGSHDDRPWFVFGGAAAAFLLAVVLGTLATVPPDWVVLIGGCAVTSAAMLALWPWVRDGRLPLIVPAIAMAVLLVNLLAAGGIAFPAVAGSLWILLAIGLNEAGVAADWHQASWGKGLALLAIAVILIVGCYATAYSPVLQRRGAIQAARAAMDPTLTERYLERAAAADALSAEPWHELASLALNRCLAGRAPRDEDVRKFENDTAESLAREPKSHATWAAAGNRYLALYEKTRRPEHLQAAVKAYRKAVDLYPHNAVHRARLALALESSGDQAGFDQQREEALWLDEFTPHPEKKLPSELRKQLQRNTSERK